MPLPKTVRFLRGVCAAIALAALSKYAAAANYFVSPCGNDAWAGVVNNCVGPLGAKRTIQAAINAASSGDQIFVMAGTYLGTIDTDGKAVRIFGPAGPLATILDGNGAQHVVTINSLEGAGTIIEGLTITGGDSPGPNGGGGALIVFSSPTFINCVFEENQSDVDGGGVWASVASPTFTDCEFRLNDAGASGGGLFASNATITLNNCTFDENEANGGGGLAFNGGNYTLEDCSITDNHAISGGGGMRVRNNANVSMTSTNVVSNTSGHIGGGIHAFEGSDVSFADGGISSNQAVNIGGGISLLSDATFNGDDVVLAGNTAASLGGGAFLSNATIELDGAIIWANSATSALSGWGGAAKLENGSDATFIDCQFESNSAAGPGGALHLAQSACSISSSSFEDHDSGGSGGAVWAHASNLQVQSTSFTTGQAGAHGGAIALSSMPSGAATFNDCTFSQNDALDSGGAMYGMDSSIEIDSCAFFLNHGETYGGALLTEGAVAHDIQIRDTVIQGNSAGTLGGAVRSFGSASMSVLRSDILGNQCSNAGGGLSFGGLTLRMDACRVIGNSGTQGAGLSVSDDAHGVLVNSIFSENISSNFGGGILVGGSAVAEVINCTVTGNTATNFSSGIHNSGELLLIRNSIVWNNSGMQIGGNSVYDARYSILPRTHTGAGCFHADPQFVNAVARDFSLTPGSPAIDAGLNWLLPADDLDADDDGDVLERVDVDHDGNARVADGANGACVPAAIVDIGAIESAGAVGSVEDGDINGDGIVNVSDLLAIISGWGNAFTCSHVDLNGDGTVNVTDLLIVISNWG